ncbi:MAG: PFL family protein [Evtepia sp.]|nr:PFL family protein [Evtepia sp.]
MITSSEILQTIHMFDQQHLDIRTITMGISLLDCANPSRQDACRKIYDKICRRAEKLVSTGQAIEKEFGIPIINKRVSVTPISLVAAASDTADYAPFAAALDKAAKAVGIDFIGGFSALVQKGFSQADRKLITSIPEALATTDLVCSSVNVGSTKAGINMDAVAEMGRVLKQTAHLTASSGGFGCAKLVIFANIPQDVPFMAGAYLGVGEPDVVINVGVSGPGVVKKAIDRAMQSKSAVTLSDVAEVIKRTAYKVTKVGEIIGQEVAQRLEVPFGVADLSLAPTPAVGDSVGEIFQSVGLSSIGAPGSTAVLAMLNDAVKKGGAFASSHVGGLSGAFIPVSEDSSIEAATRSGALTLEKLEAMTSVCSVGLDMIAIPGDTPASTIAGIIADEMAIGMINNKTTAVRVIPVPGKGVGEKAAFGGLLGEADIIPVPGGDASAFIRLGGRIPAPIHSLKN